MNSETNNYNLKFKHVILENSHDKKNFSKAVKEWVYYGEMFEEESKCICGHYIFENCIIHNTINKKSLITGNWCIKKVDVERKPATKSKKNYIELCLFNAGNTWERDFVNNISERLETYPALKLSVKQVMLLEKLSGMPYRWKWAWDDESIIKYNKLHPVVHT